METAIIIVCVAQIITLIVFFIMAANISTIKKEINTIRRTILKSDTPAVKLIQMADQEKYIGNIEKTREYLLRAKHCYEVKKEPHLSNGRPVDVRFAIAEIDKKLASL